MNLISVAYACCNDRRLVLFQLMHTTNRRFYVDILAHAITFLVEYIKYSVLQNIILPFSLPHLAISVLAAVRPETGHMIPISGRGSLERWGIVHILIPSPQVLPLLNYLNFLFSCWPGPKALQCNNYILWIRARNMASCTAITTCTYLERYKIYCICIGAMTRFH